MYHQRFKTESERFVEKYEVVPSGCFQWKSKTEYPKFFVSGAYIKASRYAWQKANGRTLSQDEHVCHKCDNPRCVNPEHLFVGTHTDNMRDKVRKGRSPDLRSEKNGRAVLDKQKANAIRELHATGKLSQDRIGSLFGVSQETVSRVVLRKAWV